MSNPYSYFFAYDTPGGLSVVRKRADDSERFGYVCRVGEKTNRAEVFRLVGDLLADMDDNYQLVSFNSQRVFMAFLCKQVPQPNDGLLLALRHVDLMFLALAKTPAEGTVTEYHLPHTNPAHSKYAYAMLDYIEAVATGVTKIDYTSGWTQHAAKTWNITGQLPATNPVTIHPLKTVGDLLSDLQHHVTRGRALKDYYNWMFDYKDNLLAILAESEKEGEISA